MSLSFSQESNTGPYILRDTKPKHTLAFYSSAPNTFQHAPSDWLKSFQTTVS
jgi:hypothetical protein